MALDGIFIYSILNELRETLLNGKVEKINQPEKDEIILNIRNGKVTYKLLISANPTYPKIHITNNAKSNPLVAPMFCMLLRKYLSGGKILDIRQQDTDRVLYIDFENNDELGFNSIYTLVIEIMGRHSNVTLVRHRDKVIMDSIKHITPDINTVRSLYPGIKYVFPPESHKLNPLNFSFESFNAFFDENNLEFDENIFSKLFTGISKPYSISLFEEYIKTTTLDAQNDHRYVFYFIENKFKLIKSAEYTFITYSDGNLLKDFYCFPLSQFDNYAKKSFNSPSELIEEYYSEKDKSNRLNSKSSNIHKLISTNIDRCNKKSKILQNTLKECDDKDKFKFLGELLTANIYSLKPSLKHVSLLNYYAEEEEYIDITLDPQKSPSENIQLYFKKYNKLKKSEEAALIQMKINIEELEYLNSVLTNIKNSDNYEEINEIKKELVETGYIKFKKTDKKAKQKDKLSKPLHFLSSDGIDIYVGKNNFQNDALTLKFAEKHDLWLHTKNIPGSHVIIKKFGEIPDNTLKEASALAAFFSKVRESSKVEVDYTEVKNVKKPSGAKPGMVIYSTNKTILADPMSPEQMNLENKK